MFGFINRVDKVILSPRDLTAEVSSVNSSSERITICSVSSSYDNGSVIN